MYTVAKNGRRVGCPGRAQGKLLWAVYDIARQLVDELDGSRPDSGSARARYRSNLKKRLRTAVNRVARAETARRESLRVAPKRPRRVR